MARGKQAAKASARKLKTNEARLHALTAEIEAERDALRDVQDEERRVEALREDLASAKNRHGAATSADLDELRAEAEILETGLHAGKAADARVHHEWERILGSAFDAFGGGVEGFEQVMKIIGGGGYFIGNENRDDLGTERVTRLQFLRGDRKRVVHDSITAAEPTAVSYRDFLRVRHVDEWLAAGLPVGPVARDELRSDQVEVFERLERIALGVVHSHPTTLRSDAMHAWHPLPWITSPTYTTSPALAALGAVVLSEETQDESNPNGPDFASAVWPTPTPALPATTRKRLAHESDIDGLVDEWHSVLVAGAALNRVLGKHHETVALGPRHPRPGRAASLRHLYTKSAIGAWSRATQAAPAQALPWGEIAIGFCAATAFWLPAGQTFAFADSDPLAQEDIGDLLLPYPQVFLAFAEPLVLDPQRVGSAAEVEALGDLDQAMTLWGSSSAKNDLNDLITSLKDADSLMLDIGDALDIRGGKVEGVLLLADSLGRIDDTFAWCINLPSGAGGSLGRHVVPASMAGSDYRQLVENLVAVAAWADWHPPDVPTSIPLGGNVEEIVEMIDTPAFRRDADTSGGGGVHVLNIRSTLRSTPNDATEPTGRRLAPHVRRGHWRRQRFGPGSKQLRRIRIAPTTVNAGLGEMKARVYVMQTQSD